MSGEVSLEKPRWIYFYLWRYLGRPIYIGQTGKKDPRQRLKEHLKSKYSLGTFLRENWQKCTDEILDVKVWDIRLGRYACAIEKALIDLYETWRPDGFNLMSPKAPCIFPSGFQGKKHTFESRRKISECHKGRKQSKEWVKKRTGKRWVKPRHFETSLASALLGRKMTRSEAASFAGVKGGRAGKGISKPGSGWGGRKLSEEHKKKISEGLNKLEPGILGSGSRGKKLSEEHRLKVIKTLRRGSGT